MKSFSELTSASQVDNADLVAISQSTGNGYASKKTTVGDVTKGVYASNGVMGAKNLNIYPYHYESQEIRGITWTVNSDGTVTANGTATADSNFVCHSRSRTDLHNLILPNGKYIISGCPSGGSASTYSMAMGRTYNGQYASIGTDYGDGKEVTLNGDDYSATEVEVHLALTIRNGQTANNMVFKPMIRLASDSDATFQPYAMTNLELTKAVESGGGGTGGHTIIDENGTSMTARSGLQFFGAVEVTDDSANNRTLVEILGGDFYNPVIYSTEERVIGVWTDGKPLYAKTFDLGSDLLVSTTSWTTLGITLDADKIVGTKTTSTSGSFQGNILVYNDNGTWKGQTPRNGNDSSYVRYLTMVYTKTTDVAGSGSWTPQGVPSVHYSTDEQIIGTWFGETLYQKTLHISNVQFDSTGVYDLNLTSMGTDILIADNSCSYYTFSTYVRNFEKLVPEDGHIYCYGVANRPITDGYITIKYTKTS